MKKNIFKIAFVCMVSALVFTGCASETEKEMTDGTKTTAQATAVPTPAVEKSDYELTVLEADKVYYADIDIEGYGKITFKLDQNTAPETCENFYNLVNDGFYDGLTLHRIISGFMIQGGDPQGNGTGGSDKNIRGEFSGNGIANDISHTRGTVSMARAQSPNSASSQFFIVHEDSTFLDGQYAGFGVVTEGIEVVDKICESVKVEDANGTVAPENQPVINSIKIRNE